MKHLMINSPDDIHLHLKRLMYARNVNAQKLSKEAGIPYSRLIRTLRNEREFTASEIGSVARYMGIEDINKFFLGGRAQ